MSATKTTDRAACPSELQLEAYLMKVASAVVAVEPHLATCARCLARVEAMERAGAEFRQYVFPATVGTVAERGSKQALWRRWTTLFALPGAAVAALLLVFLNVSPFDAALPPEDYVGVKGGLAFSVYAATGDGAVLVNDGAAVQPGASLRFRVGPSAPCRLWVVSVDGSSRVSRIFPASGEGGAWIADAGALPGGAVLDELEGPERLFTICTPSTLPYSEVERAVQRAAGGGMDAVRGAGVLSGLPPGTLQESVLLEKKLGPQKE